MQITVTDSLFIFHFCLLATFSSSSFASLRLFLYRKFASITRKPYLCTRKSGCSAVGSVPGLGPGGRPFESGRPDDLCNEEGEAPRESRSPSIFLLLHFVVQQTIVTSTTNYTLFFPRPFVMANTYIRNARYIYT